MKAPDKSLPEEAPGKIDEPTDTDVTEEAPAEDASSEAETPADADATHEGNAGGETDTSTEATPTEGETATDEAATEG